MRPQPPPGALGTPAPVCGMSAGGCDGAADRPAEEGRAGSSLPAVELPRKRKGDMEERLSVDCKMEDDLSREPHRQIEKRRRDKMNNLIDELSAMIPACQPMAQKPDKLTVLRKAVQHLKALKVGTSSAFADSTNKPSILPQDDLRQLLLRAADGFMLVVSCDRAKILFISESVSKILNFSLVQTDALVRPTHLSSGAWRSFFCRMKHSRVAGKQEEKHLLPCTAKKKDTSRYCTLHCTGYMRSCPSSQLDSEGDAEKETPSLSCLVMLCRPLPHGSPSLPKISTPSPLRSLPAVPSTGSSLLATTVIVYLPQEVLGTSCYEYFHQDDLQHLAEKHRQGEGAKQHSSSDPIGNIGTFVVVQTFKIIDQLVSNLLAVLRSKEKIETQCYKFKTKYGSYVSLQSQWFSFTNPWTKEVEFIVSSNRVMSGPSHIKDEEAGRLKAMQEETKQIPIIPSLSNGVGTMIYAGSIGTQIANELIDSYRVNSSPSSGASSPFGSTNEKCPLVSPPISTSASSGGGAASSSSQSDSRTAAGASSATADSSGEVAQLDLDGMVVPALSSFSSDEAAMAVIMSLLETEVNVEAQQRHMFSPPLATKRPECSHNAAKGLSKRCDDELLPWPLWCRVGVGIDGRRCWVRVGVGRVGWDRVLRHEVWLHVGGGVGGGGGGGWEVEVERGGGSGGCCGSWDSLQDDMGVELRLGAVESGKRRLQQTLLTPAGGKDQHWLRRLERVSLRVSLRLRGRHLYQLSPHRGDVTGGEILSLPTSWYPSLHQKANTLPMDTVPLSTVEPPASTTAQSSVHSSIQSWVLRVGGPRLGDMGSANEEEEL
ncbi:hypothetical protein F7725_021804, partial [Dissostichus mawsoni]